MRLPRRRLLGFLIAAPWLAVAAQVDDNRVMREFAIRLSDAGVEALADYYAGR